MIDVNTISARGLVSGGHDLCWVIKPNNASVGSIVNGLEDWACGPVETCGYASIVGVVQPVSYATSVPYLPVGDVTPNIANPLQITRSIGMPFEAALGASSFGVVKLADPAQAVPVASLRNQTCEILVGGLLDQGLATQQEIEHADFKLLARGAIRGVARRGNYSDVTLVSADSLIDVDFMETYSGSGGADGYPGIAGSIKPFRVGSPENVECIDLGGGVWHIHSGALSAIRAVRGDGVALTGNGGVDDVFSTTPSAGEYYYDLSQSLIKVGGEPALVTADVDCVVGDVFSNDAAEIIKSLVLGYTAITDVSIDADLPSYSIGWEWRDSVSVAEAIQDIAWRLNWLVYVDLSGVLVIRPRANLVTSNVKLAVSESHIINVNIRNTVVPRFWRMLVGYARNFTVQDRAQLPGAARQKYSTEYLYNDTTNHSARYMDSGTLTVPSPVLNKQDSATITDSLERLGAKLQLADISLAGLGWKISRGDVLSVDDPDLPGACEVLRVIDDSDGLLTTLEVLNVS